MLFDKSEAFLEDKSIRIPVDELYDSLKILCEILNLEIEIKEDTSLFYELFEEQFDTELTKEERKK